MYVGHQSLFAKAVSQEKKQELNLHFPHFICDLFVSKMHQNAPICILFAKKFRGGHAPGPP